METEKDKWINGILSSGEKLSGLQAPEYLQQRILDRLDEASLPAVRLSSPQFVRLLAAASILLVINVGVLLYSSQNVPKSEPAAYSLESYNLSLYWYAQRKNVMDGHHRINHR